MAFFCSSLCRLSKHPSLLPFFPRLLSPSFSCSSSPVSFFFCSFPLATFVFFLHSPFLTFLSLVVAPLSTSPPLLHFFPLVFTSHVPSSLILPSSSPTSPCLSSPLSSSPPSLRIYSVCRQLKPAGIKSRHIKPFTRRLPLFFSSHPFSSSSFSFILLFHGSVCVFVFQTSFRLKDEGMR